MLAPSLAARTLVVALAGFITCFAALTPAPAQAQAGGKGGAKGGGPKPQYAEIPLDDHPDWKGLRTKLMEKGAFENDDESKVFTAHYNWVASFLTHHSGAKGEAFNISKQGDKIADTRIKLKAELLTFARGKPSTACHDALVAQLAKMLPNLFNSDKYHPVTRVNALWLYGELNSKEGDSPVVPLPEAFPVLMKLYANDTQPAYLRATALGGLARHAEAGAAPDASKELVAEMLKLLKAPPAGFKPEVYDFLRLRAVDVLRNVALKGPAANTPSVFNTLNALAQDSKTPLDLRCEALRAIGSLESKAINDAIKGDKAASSASIRGIAKLALEIAQQAPAPEEEAGDDAPAVAPKLPPALQTNQLASVTQDPVAAEDAQAPAADPANAAQVPAAAPPAADAEAAAAPKQGGGLAPDVQTYMLGCLQTALVGDPKAPAVDKNVKRGIAFVASDADKKFLTEFSGKLGDIYKAVRSKKQGDQLTRAEYDKLQKAIDALKNALESSS